MLHTANTWSKNNNNNKNNPKQNNNQNENKNMELTGSGGELTDVTYSKHCCWQTNHLLNISVYIHGFVMLLTLDREASYCSRSPLIERLLTIKVSVRAQLNISHLWQSQSFPQGPMTHHGRIHGPKHGEEYGETLSSGPDLAVASFELPPAVIIGPIPCTR